MNIVLIGYRGTGKSTVTSMLAESLGWNSISTDAQIIQHAKLSIPEIVSQFGWEYFRNLEVEICQNLTTKDQLVIDTGGGAILRGENVEAFQSNGTLIWLQADVSTILQRISGDTQRPSLQNGRTFLEEIKDVLRERTPKYQAVADHSIATDQLSPEQVVEKILSLHQWI